MAAFIKLEDSPMFQKQVRSLEQTTDELRDRCQKLYKGCKKFVEALGESCNGDMVFAESLEAFGGGLDDPVSVSIGGPIISKFNNALRELATYKEFLRSQVEHVLVDQLSQIVSVDLQDAKDCRRRFDKSTYVYDQARERFASLKKSTREEVITEVEEDLHNSKSAFERSRFNLVNALMNIEAKKKYEFLESFSAIMDAHLRYFKLGYDLLSQLEPFIHEVLTYAQQSKEHANIEQDKLAKRIQEFRTQAELANLRPSSNIATSTGAIGMNGFDLSSYKSIEGITQSTAKGEVQTLKQGISFEKIIEPEGRLEEANSLFLIVKALYTIIDQKVPNMGVLLRIIPPIQWNIIVVYLIDAEDTDMRLCFRIISPSKTYTLRAESEADRIDWMDKITGAIASLLNSHLQQLGANDMDENNDSSGASFSQRLDNKEKMPDNMRVNRADSVSRILKEIPGNDQCAECSASEPDWASLNLGVLICIECSGIHRNLGVHISKVRSVTLDVKVWEPTILGLFQTLGNEYCNSVWEELLLLQKDGLKPDALPSVTKPSPKDAIPQKEKYIQAKYVGKLLVKKEDNAPGIVRIPPLSGKQFGPTICGKYIELLWLQM
ncbi:ADP-ribosylation factor GTPase-activating protein AGD2 [Abeliophyllum distichum]|uniref:ADP-ribosylation factor GTPase-activating protein AGD2 n=1 Tax=Abeliophyllum distichum TaxID=126358 RepID=A0ABD1VV86_9LAMI